MARVGPQNFTTFADDPGVIGGTVVWANPAKAALADDDPATAVGFLSPPAAMVVSSLINGVIILGALGDDVVELQVPAAYAYVTQGSASVLSAAMSGFTGADLKAAGFGVAVTAVDQGPTLSHYLVCSGADFSAVPDAAPLIGFTADVRCKLAGDVLSIDHVRATAYFTGETPNRATAGGTICVSGNFMNVSPPPRRPGK